MAVWTETRMDRWTQDGTLFSFAAPFKYPPYCDQNGVSDNSLLGSGPLRQSMAKFSLWFASFDGSYGCVFNFGSLSQGGSGLEVQRDGEVLASCVIDLCDIFARELVLASTYRCCLSQAWIFDDSMVSNVSSVVKGRINKVVV